MKNCLLLRSNLQAYLLCFRWTASLYAILQNSCLKVCAHLHIPPLLTLKHECESRHTWRNGNKCLLPFLSFKDNFSCEHSMLLYAHVFRAEPSLFIISNDQFIISRPRSWLIFFSSLSRHFLFILSIRWTAKATKKFLFFFQLTIHRWHQSHHAELA